MEQTSVSGPDRQKLANAVERLTQAYQRSIRREQAERQAGTLSEPHKWKSGMRKRIDRLKRLGMK